METFTSLGADPPCFVGNKLNVPFWLHRSKANRNSLLWEEDLDL